MQNKDGLAPLETAPFVLFASSQNGQHIFAANAAAGRLGFYKGQPLADARAIFPTLIVEAADSEGDDKALLQLALWHQCYSPFVRADAPNGISIDITGCAHLFGGEAALLENLQQRLRRFGLTEKLGIAPTIAAAFAAARYGPAARGVITDETLHDHLAPLPVAALQLEAVTVAALAKVGLHRIRDLIGKPRAPLVARFGPQLMMRLDQAFAKQDETFGALAAPPFYRALRRFAEPLITMPAIEYVVQELAADLAAALNRAGKGARKAELSLFRVDGWSETLAIHMSALGLSRDGRHLARLLCERLDKVKDHRGFGFEAATLSAFDVEKYVPYQNVLKTEEKRCKRPADLARLTDRLVNRFGYRNVTRFAPSASYIPERSASSTPALQGAAHHDWRTHLRVLQGGNFPGRPLLLFASPEPVKTLAEVPDGPPIRFEWRRRWRRVARAEGPERIAPEWWRKYDKTNRQTRDYYRVEDDDGRRFWLYRDGLHERPGDKPRWFMHGLFA